MKNKIKNLFFKSDNLAVPEVKTGEANIEDDTENGADESIRYENLAIPEIKLTENKKKKNQ